MGEVINLNRFRKQRTRAEDEKQAAENRVAFGRTKAERTVNAKGKRKAQADLEGKKLD
jgi:hypothetical protein